MNLQSILSKPGELLPKPTDLMSIWEKLSDKPGGKAAFSMAVGKMAPYTGTIGANVEELRPGYAKVTLEDRKKVRNHLNSIHAIALMNLGELCTGLASMSALPEGGRGIIVELGMTYAKKARGTITGEATVEMPTESGTHDLQIEGVLTDESGEEVARAKAVWRLDVP